MLTLALGAGCARGRFASQTLTHYVIKVSGPAGMDFSGRMRADGNIQTLAGVTPQEWAVDSHVLDLRIKQHGDAGPMKVEVYNGERLMTSATLPGAGGHFRLRSRDGQSTKVTTWQVRLGRRHR